MTNLFSSFDQALPDIETHLVKPAPTESGVSESGSNTRRCEPPISAFSIPVEHWHEKAEDLCLRDQNRRNRLEQGHMPGQEAAQWIYSEQDVVNASTLHFTHPVNVALSLVHRDDSYLCEVTKGKSNTTSGGTSSRSRADTLYFKGPPKQGEHPGTSNHPMACLEFKKVKTLKAQNFRNRIVTTIEAHQGRLAAIADGDVERLPAEKNVSILLSQATHYALKFKTPFIALFDYQTLILLVMDQAIEEGGKAKGGEFTYMTVISDSSQFRKAFLGFLLCAHQHAEKNGNWKVARDRTDILTKAANLGSMTGGGRRSNTRPERGGGPVSYREPSSSDSSRPSSQGSPMQMDTMRRAAQNAPADGRKTSGHAKTSSSLSSSRTSSVRTATTVSSTGSRGTPVKSHATSAAAAHAAPNVTKTATIPARPKIEASKTGTKAVSKTDTKTASKTDTKAGASKTATKIVASRQEPIRR
ncbi:hypothetical protein N8I77_002997 [Diaporthe amygdali]|uniref:Uncharacterized protein n=1 Tax=Phomopsis amygdali TaxID=1214568 RepID=A0AAD9SJ20_PHOAM|nr:hypothetical protein N8I77_002997 [Diaporthe amygdali]